MNIGQSFWLVWNPKREVPTHRHNTKQSAINEAERLARLQRGDTFYILQAVQAISISDIQRIELGDYRGPQPYNENPIPF